MFKEQIKGAQGHKALNICPHPGEDKPWVSSCYVVVCFRLACVTKPMCVCVWARSFLGQEHGWFMGWLAPRLHAFLALCGRRCDGRFFEAFTGSLLTFVVAATKHKAAQHCKMETSQRPKPFEDRHPPAGLLVGSSLALKDAPKDVNHR